MSPDGTIYLIGENPTSGAVKIGWTATMAGVMSRLRAMQTGNSRELVLLHTFPGSMIEERAIHRYFRKLHVRGEWFRLDVRDLVAATTANDFIEQHAHLLGPYGGPFPTLSEVKD